MKINPITFPIAKHQTLLNKKYNNNSKVDAGYSAKNDLQSQNFYTPLSLANYNISMKGRIHYSPLSDLKCRSENFAVLRFDNIPCPDCGKTMLPRAKYNKIVNMLNNNIKPEDYLDYIGQYKNYMRPVEESVYEELTDLSKKINEKDISKLVLELREMKLPELEATQNKQLTKMKKLAKHLPDNEKNILMENIDLIEKEIDRNNPQTVFRRKIMIDRIGKIPIRNKRKYLKLQKLAKDFPTSSAMNAAWIVKYSGLDKYGNPYDSKTIATRFLLSSVPSADHILAYNIEHGHDDITNYMAMHSGCNGQKENKHMLTWLNEDRDNRIVNMKKYFLAVNELIKSKKINTPKYKDYVAFATHRIQNLTNNSVKLFPEEEFPLTDEQKKLLTIKPPQEIIDYNPTDN